MNPLALPAPDFLPLYVSLLGLAVPLALVLGWWLRLPDGEPHEKDLHDLTPYEIAELSGGPTLMVNAALARLVHEGYVTLETSKGQLRMAKSLPGQPEPIEAAVRGAIAG